MKYPVKVSGKDLLQSSVVHLGPNDDVSVDVDNLALRFVFEDDTNDKSGRYSGAVEGGVLCFTLTNFNNPLGEGVLVPLEIGTLKKRKLFLTFFASTVVNKERRFEFSLLLGDSNE